MCRFFLAALKRGAIAVWMAALFVGALAFCGLMDAAAQASAWTPDAIGEGAWHSTKVAPPNALMKTNSVTCPGTRTEWIRAADGTMLNLIAWACPDDNTAGLLLESAELAHSQLDESNSVFGPDIGYSMDLRSHSREVAVQSWAQGPRIFYIAVDCHLPHIDSCAGLAARMARSFSPTQPGSRQHNSTNTNLFAQIIAIPASSWAMFIALPGFLRWIARARYPTRQDDFRWTNVDTVARGLRWRSFGWGTVIGIRRLTYSLAIILVLGHLITSPVGRIVTTVVSLGIIGVSIFLSRRLYHPVFGSVWPFQTLRLVTRSPGKLVAGFTIRALARAMALLVAASYVFIVLIYVYGGSSGPLAQFALNRAFAGQRSLNPVQWWLVTLVLVSDSATYVGFVLMGTATVALLLDRLALRILRPAIADVRIPGQPDILYLRNFEDDTLKLHASRISRRGVLGRFSPLRKRPFEEIIVTRLSAAGFIHAVSSGGLATSRPGVLKERFANDVWQAEVLKMAREAFLVVISATPTDIKEGDGIAWELEQVATTIGHERIVLLLAPWPSKSELIDRWGRFCDFTRKWSLFAPIRELGSMGAACVVAHIPGLGWRAWGARSKTEWTYAAAVHLAIDSALDSWKRDHARIAVSGEAPTRFASRDYRSATET